MAMEPGLVGSAETALSQLPQSDLFFERSLKKCWTIIIGLIEHEYPFPKMITIPPLSDKIAVSERQRYYAEKWRRISAGLPLAGVPEADLDWIRRQFIEHGLSYQQARQLCGRAGQLQAWKEPGLHHWTVEAPFWSGFQARWSRLIENAPSYTGERPRSGALDAHPVRFETVERQGKLMRTCPAYSDDYVCCGLKVINVAENCTLGCSYCVLQAFYDDRTIRITSNLRERLLQLEREQLEPGRRYRIGTGEYSDSLLWGNAEGLLDDLIGFARRNPCVCLELKTKSIRVDPLLERRADIPANLVVSWSVNPQHLIRAEEQRTPALEQRLAAARRLADAGVLVGFHLHPMVRYEGCEADYPEMMRTLTAMFDPEEVLWLSQGTLNFVRGHREKLQVNHPDSKLLRTPLVKSQQGKWGYPTDQRIALYRLIEDAFDPWRDKVFRYLCMEGAEVYHAVLGYAYSSNTLFDDVMNDAVFSKIDRHR